MNLVVEAASLVIMLVGIALGLGLLAWLARAPYGPARKHR